MQFSGKVALVTGGSSGIGRASALAFARDGASVVIGDVADQRGAEVVAEIEAAGGAALYVHADATASQDVKALVAAATAHFGRLDFVHSNVGLSWGYGFDITEDEWDRSIAFCLKAPWLCLKHALPVLAAQGGGSIVSTASMAGVRYTNAANVAYSSGKAALIFMARYAAVAYAAQNIRVNTVSPGLTRTHAVERFMDAEQQRAFAAETQPIGRIIEPEEIADTVIWLCSERAAMVTGENICVAGGHQAA